uniref:DNA repair protein SWI5 homolog n=1 Tax=Trichobilharzia regenti TaxID=157069 RepID=A0AA85J9B5_TRIRE
NSQTHPKSTERRVDRPQCEHDKEQQPEKENIPSCNVGDSTDVNKHDNDDDDDDDDDREIEKCIEELLSRRQNQSCINLDIELGQWRNRLHAYNEAKDSCIILFGLLANNRGCLVRELYQEFGMDLDD